MDNINRRPRRPRTPGDSKNRHHSGQDTKSTTTSPHRLSLARSLIDQLPDHSLRDVLHSVAHLTLVQEALVTSTLPPTSSEASRSKRPKLPSPTPTGSQHDSPLSRSDYRPTRHDLSATTQPVTQTGPLTPQMQQIRKQLLVLIHRVNVYYSNTFNTADAVTCLLNIAHRALDSHSVPIRSTTSTAPESIADQTVSELASSSGSSLPTPPRTLEVDTASLSTRTADIIPMADDILSSLVMILIQYPRSKRMAFLTSQDETPAWTERKATSDDCDLTDALIEMVYALLDHEHYRERPLAARLSEFLVQIALQRERKFREQERQKRKPMLAIRSGTYSSSRFVDCWRQGQEQLNGASDDFGRQSGIEGDTIGHGGVDSVEADMRSKTKKRLREQQSKRCQVRLGLGRQGLEQDDWGSDVMSQTEMESPFLVN